MADLTRDEMKFLVELVELDIYRRNETIQKVLDHPFDYIDDVEELKRRNSFAMGIVEKLKKG